MMKNLIIGLAAFCHGVTAITVEDAQAHEINSVEEALSFFQDKTPLGVLQYLDANPKVEQLLADDMEDDPDGPVLQFIVGTFQQGLFQLIAKIKSAPTHEDIAQARGLLAKLLQQAQADPEKNDTTLFDAVNDFLDQAEAQVAEAESQAQA